jgi:3-deoxy-D-manno-octulosonic-acid transferase
MYLAYSLLLTLGLLVLVPRFIFQAIAHGKYVAGFRQRLGSIPDLRDELRPVIWIHCVSVGETQAARPLVRRLRNEFPGHSLVISTITQTGQRLAREVFQDQVAQVFYFPFDWRWSVRRAFARINPNGILLMETELWPNFLRECQRRHIPVALVNGRISSQSFRRYHLVKPFIVRVLSALYVAAMQTNADADRMARLGMSTERIFATGNLKFDVGPVPTTAVTTEEIRNRFRLQPGVPLILAASTHAPEETIIIESFLNLKRQYKEPVRLLLAPRHPERFQEVASLLDNAALKWARRTNAQRDTDPDAEIILLDTIGELPATYSLASIVFVGGSIVDKGGHNVLEPAAAGNCIVTGPHTSNFRAIVDLLLQGGALLQLAQLNATDQIRPLSSAFLELLMDPERRTQMGLRAKQLFDENNGATDRTISLVKPLFGNAVALNSVADSFLPGNASSS